jgi:hypothetical protein
MTIANPITYWSGILAANHPLAQIVLDYLLIPGEFINYYDFSFSVLISIFELHPLILSAPFPKVAS